MFSIVIRSFIGVEFTHKLEVESSGSATSLARKFIAENDAVSVNVYKDNWGCIFTAVKTGTENDYKVYSYPVRGKATQKVFHVKAARPVKPSK